MAVLQRWATLDGKQLRAPLGLDREALPHATTISRALSRCTVGEFAAAFYAWLRQVVLSDQPLTVAVDGKTSCQGLDTDGEPVQLLTVFVHNRKLVLAKWSVRGDKTNEPGALRLRLAELLREYGHGRRTKVLGAAYLRALVIGTLQGCAHGAWRKLGKESAVVALAGG